MWKRVCATATSGPRKRTCISGVSRVLARNGPVGPCRRRIRSRKPSLLVVHAPLTVTNWASSRSESTMPSGSCRPHASLNLNSISRIASSSALVITSPTDGHRADARSLKHNAPSSADAPSSGDAPSGANAASSAHAPSGADAPSSVKPIHAKLVHHGSYLKVHSGGGSLAASAFRHCEPHVNHDKEQAGADHGFQQTHHFDDRRCGDGHGRGTARVRAAERARRIGHAIL